MNYATYPLKNMRITQNYKGTTSHKPHTQGNYKDYPIDDGGKDTSREGVYCPCDEIKIVRLYGERNKGTNTIFFESTSECVFPDGTSDYLCGLITHSNDTDLAKLEVGQKIKRGKLICNEGTDGGVGMHTHLAFGKGKLLGNGWRLNNKGKYVLYCSGGAFKPEKLLYVDKKFTKVISSKGLTFKELPAYKKGIYKVTADVLNVRTGTGTNYTKKVFGQLTPNAQMQIKKLNGGKSANGLVKGCTCTVSQVKDNWGKIPSGWICLDYCERVD